MRICAFVVSVSLAPSLLLAETAQERVKKATEVFDAIMAVPDKAVPNDLLQRAHCVIIVPDLKKGAFIVGGQYGRGFTLCRQADQTGWGAPSAVRLEGGSVGFQIGGSSTDVVMLVMNKGGMEKLAQSKFTLGGDASVAAGPVGRTAAAQTDALMEAEILAWSRSKGVFAGISLAGSTLRNDLDENQELYGKKIDLKQVLSSKIKPPEEAVPLIARLSKYSYVEGKKK